MTLQSGLKVLLVVLITFLIILGLSAVAIAAATAAEPETAPAAVCISPINGYFNVRQPAGGTVVATVVRGTTVPVTGTPVAGWWQTGQGLVAGSVASVGDCPSSPTSPATRTPEPTFTPADTPMPLLILSDGRPLLCQIGATWIQGDDWYLAAHCQLLHPLGTGTPEPTPTKVTP